MLGKNTFGFTLLAALTGLAAACNGPEITDLGGNGGTPTPVSSGSSPTPTPSVAPGSFALTLNNDGSQAPQLELRGTKDVNFTITPNNISGSLTVGVVLSGLPASITASATSTSVTVTGSTPVSGKFTLVTDNTTAIPGAYTGVTLTGTATYMGNTLSDNKTATVTVLPQVTFTTLSAAPAGGSCAFWDPNAVAIANAGANTCTYDATHQGTVIHYGTATGVQVVWVKNWGAAEQHRVHGNGTSAGLTALAANKCGTDGASACNDANSGPLVHSVGSGTETALPSALVSDETGNGGGLLFVRYLAIATPGTTATIDYYDHLSGGGNGQLTNYGAHITLMP